MCTLVTLCFTVLSSIITASFLKNCVLVRVPRQFSVYCMRGRNAFQYQIMPIMRSLPADGHLSDTGLMKTVSGVKNVIYTFMEFFCFFVE